jgi:hypothetical protein
MIPVYLTCRKKTRNSLFIITIKPAYPHSSFNYTQEKKWDPKKICRLCLPELLHRICRTGKCPHKISRWCEIMKKTRTTPLPEKKSGLDWRFSFFNGRSTPTVTPQALCQPGRIDRNGA